MPWGAPRPRNFKQLMAHAQGKGKTSRRKTSHELTPIDDVDIGIPAPGEEVRIAELREQGRAIQAEEPPPDVDPDDYPELPGEESDEV